MTQFSSPSQPTAGTTGRVPTATENTIFGSRPHAGSSNPPGAFRAQAERRYERVSEDIQFDPAKPFDPVHLLQKEPN